MVRNSLSTSDAKRPTINAQSQVPQAPASQTLTPSTLASVSANVTQEILHPPWIASKALSTSVPRGAGAIPRVRRQHRPTISQRMHMGNAGACIYLKSLVSITNSPCVGKSLGVHTLVRHVLRLPHLGRLYPHHHLRHRRRHQHLHKPVMRHPENRRQLLPDNALHRLEWQSAGRDRLRRH